MDKFEELKKYQEEQIDKIREYVFAQLGKRQGMTKKFPGAKEK